MRSFKTSPQLRNVSKQTIEKKNEYANTQSSWDRVFPLFQIHFHHIYFSVQQNFLLFFEELLHSKRGLVRGHCALTCRGKKAIHK